MALKVTTPLDYAKESVRILQEVLHTPFLRSLKFELSVEIESLPIVTYTVERIAVKEQEVEHES